MSTVEVVKMTGLLELSVNQLRFDTDVQCRASIDSGTVTEYKEALSANVVFPPLVVFHDGAVYWVADGFHRGEAYRQTGATKCPCDVRQGTKRDAILYACGANGKHGLPRTPADKRRAVMTLLNDTEWMGKPTRWIAETCGVGHTLVAEMKAQLSAADNSKSQPARVTGSDGKSYLAKRKPDETKPVEKVEAKPEPVREPELHHGKTTAQLAEDFGVSTEILEQAIELQRKDPEAFEKVRTGEIDGQVAYDAMKAKEKEEPEEDEGQIRILRGEVFRDMKRALLDCWARCPVQFREHLRGMVQYEVGELK